MKKILSKGIIVAVGALFASSCTNLDPKFYDKATPEQFPKTKDDFYSLMGQPYTYLGTQIGANNWIAQECTADCFVVLIRNGKHFNDGWNRVHEWLWGKNLYQVNEGFGTALNGIAWCMDVRRDIENVNYSAIGVNPDLKDQHLAEMDAIMAFFYMKGLDGYGGMPIYHSLEGVDELARSTPKQTFDHIETLLTSAIPNLSVRKLGDKYSLDRTIQQGAAAAMLAQLYLNAHAWIGEDRLSDCEEVCEDIIAGDYGDYGIENDWKTVHGFYNKDSKEMMWCIPSEDKQWSYRWFTDYFWHGKMIAAFDQDGGSMNAICLQPSRNPAGTIYADTDFKLGKPYEKFHPLDLRKKSYKYNPDGTYEGMFMKGMQYVWNTTTPITANDEYDGQPLVLVDQVARFSIAGKDPEHPSNPALLPSGVWEGEENSGFRMVKVPIPNGSSNPLRWAAAQPIIRFTEVHYMLAECRFRSGDKAGCAQIINDIKMRNFEGGVFPSGPGVDDNALVSAKVPDNLDEYRLLDEWLLEFLGEGRRRTDLLRFGKWTSDKWWGHEANTNANYKKFPLGESQLSANRLLEQNPGYDN